MLNTSNLSLVQFSNSIETQKITKTKVGTFFKHLVYGCVAKTLDHSMVPSPSHFFPLLQEEEIKLHPNIQGVSKKWYSVYFANISATKLWIFKSFFSPENGDPYVNFEYKIAYSCCLILASKPQNLCKALPTGPKRAL